LVSWLVGWLLAPANVKGSVPWRFYFVVQCLSYKSAPTAVLGGIHALLRRGRRGEQQNCFHRKA